MRRSPSSWSTSCGIEPLEELAIADREGGDRGVDDLAPLIRQLDDHAAAIVRVVESTHESAPLERSIRLVTPADDSIRPLARRVGEADTAAPRSARRSARRPRRGSGRTGRRPPPGAWRGALRSG